MVAIWEKSYKISINTGTSQVIDIVNVVEGFELFEPVIIEKKYHLLVGWFEISDLNSIVEFPLVIKSDVFLLAKWKAIAHDIDSLIYHSNNLTENVELIDDIMINQTIFITNNLVLTTNKNITIRRDRLFKDHLFVIGEDINGLNSLVLGRRSSLKFESDTFNEIIFEGENQNGVRGSVFFISNFAELYLNDILTLKNNYKSEPYFFNDDHSMDYHDSIGGSVVVNSSGTLYIDGGQYLNNKANFPEVNSEVDENSALGGVIYNHGLTIISSGLFSNNEAYKGGVIYNYRTLEITGGVFDSNRSRYGAVSFSPNSQLSGTYVYDGIFTNNSSISSGGVFFQATSSGLYIIDGIFTNNYAVNNGAVINSYGSLIIDNGLFSGNVAGSKGGVIHQYHSSTTLKARHAIINGGIFSNNKAKVGGSVVSVDSSGIVKVFGGTYYDNCVYGTDSSTDGGVFYLKNNSKLDVENIEVYNNKSTKNGGAFYIKEGSEVLIKNSLLENNVGISGGAIYISDYGSKLKISDNTYITDNKSTNGGALFSNNGSFVSLTNTKFFKNTSNSGGALFLSRDTKTVMSDVILYGNSSDSNGGSVYIKEGANLLINDSFFNNNKANGGGAIFIKDTTSNLKVIRTMFNNNSAKNGGAINISNSASTIVENSVFDGNISEAGGGAIYVSNTGGTIEIFGYTIFENNISKSHGSAIYLYTSSKASLNDVLIQDNYSYGNGTIYVNGASLDLGYQGNVIIRGNTSETNYAGIYSTKSKIDIFDVEFQVNFSTKPVSKGNNIYATTQSIIRIYKITGLSDLSDTQYYNKNNNSEILDLRMMQT